jgi:hypothetical protein
MPFWLYNTSTPLLSVAQRWKVAVCSPENPCINKNSYVPLLVTSTATLQQNFIAVRRTVWPGGYLFLFCGFEPPLLPDPCEFPKTAMSSNLSHQQLPDFIISSPCEEWSGQAVNCPCCRGSSPHISPTPKNFRKPVCPAVSRIDPYRAGKCHPSTINGPARTYVCTYPQNDHL